MDIAASEAPPIARHELGKWIQAEELSEAEERGVDSGDEP